MTFQIFIALIIAVADSIISAHSLAAPTPLHNVRGGCRQTNQHIQGSIDAQKEDPRLHTQDAYVCMQTAYTRCL